MHIMIFKLRVSMNEGSKSMKIQWVDMISFLNARILAHEFACTSHDIVSSECNYESGEFV